MIERLTVLGAGTVLPLPDYGCSGYVLHWKSDRALHPLLIDCGPGTLDRLAELGTRPDEISVILISHFHIDHVSDLAAILMSRWIRNLAKGPAAHRLTIVGPTGLGDYVDGVSRLNQPWIADYAFELVELARGSYVFPDASPFAGLRIDAVPTGHTQNSVCFRLEDREGIRVFYSGDTDYNEELVPLAREADLAIFECSMPEDRKLDGHLTPRLAGRLARKAEVRRLVLTHFYEEILSTDIEREVAREYDGPVERARKLKRFAIK